MLRLLWLIPILPIAGFAILVLFGSRLKRRAVSTIAIGSVGVSTAVTVLVAISYLVSPPAGDHYSQTLWNWFRVGDLNVNFAFYLDALSLTMVAVVTFVGLLIHLYSSAFMADDPGYTRFFAYMNLFVGSMLILLLAQDLLLTYVGWEGVGLCSYLLIGFWYKDRANARAALKAFIVTRVGDAAMAVAFFILVVHFATLDIPSLVQAVAQYPVGSTLCTVVALLLLAGAVGKSAQLPLQTWLPDAMAGPTPVSALIHAATMVTAGVYLIARTHAIFAKSPVAMMIVAAIGTTTLLLAGFSACVQHDIKRILAYSTMSQVGYMFLALGVGAWYAAIYHFITHALFKSSLFLGAGVVIRAMDEEHDIFKMGGLGKLLPATHRAFLVGVLTLAALPPLTLTFNSKDVILNNALHAPHAGWLLWVLGLAGAFLTAFYTFRLFFVVFTGPGRHQSKVTRPAVMIYTLSALAFLAALAGLPELIKALTGGEGFYDFLKTAMPGASDNLSIPQAWGLQVVYAAVSAGAMWLAYSFYCRSRRACEIVDRTPTLAQLHGLLKAGWGFDWLYTQAFVRPYRWIARVGREDVLDSWTSGLAQACEIYHRILSDSVNGRIKWYAGGIIVGALVVLAFVIFL